MDSELKHAVSRITAALATAPPVILVGLFHDELVLVAESVAKAMLAQTHWVDDWEDLKYRPDTDGALRIVDAQKAAGVRPEAPELKELKGASPLLILESDPQAWPAPMVESIPGTGPRASTDVFEAPVHRYLEGHPSLIRAAMRHPQLGTRADLNACGPDVLDLLSWEGRSARQRMSDTYGRLPLLWRAILMTVAGSGYPISQPVMSEICGASVARIVEISMVLEAMGWFAVYPPVETQRSATMKVGILGNAFIDRCSQQPCPARVKVSEWLIQVFESSDVVALSEDYSIQELRPLWGLAQWAVAREPEDATLSRLAARWLRVESRLNLASSTASSSSQIRSEPWPKSHLMQRLVHRRSLSSLNDQSAPDDTVELSSQRLISASDPQLHGLGLVERAEYSLGRGELSSASRLLEELEPDRIGDGSPRLANRIFLGATYGWAMLGRFDRAIEYIDRIRDPESLPTRWRFEVGLLASSLKLVGLKPQAKAGFGSLLQSARGGDDPVLIEAAMTYLRALELFEKKSRDIDREELPDWSLLADDYPDLVAWSVVAEVHGGGLDTEQAGQCLERLYRDQRVGIWEWRIQLEFARRLIEAMGRQFERAQLQEWLMGQQLLRWHSDTTTSEEIALPPLARHLWEQCADNSWLYERDMEPEDLVHVTAHPHGYWFQVRGEEVIDLSSRTAIRRVFRHFLERHRDDLGPVDVESLTEVGWPGEVLDYDSARARVYTTIRQLRKMGLSDALVTHHDGYGLSRAVVVHIRELTAQSARLVND